MYEWLYLDAINLWCQPALKDMGGFNYTNKLNLPVLNQSLAATCYECLQITPVSHHQQIYLPYQTVGVGWAEYFQKAEKDNKS